MLGSAQRSLCTAAEAATEIPVLVRSSGGGAVLAGPWMVSVSVVLPESHRLLGASVVESYRWLAEIHVVVLSGIGVVSRALSPSELLTSEGTSGDQVVKWACFGELSPWELVDANGRKLTGFAQRRRRTRALLVAGTLVTNCDWRLLCRAMGRPADECALRHKTMCCEELLGQRFPTALYAARLEAAIRVVLGLT